MKGKGVYLESMDNKGNGSIAVANELAMAAIRRPESTLSENDGIIKEAVRLLTENGSRELLLESKVRAIKRRDRETLRKLKEIIGEIEE